MGYGVGPLGYGLRRLADRHGGNDFIGERIDDGDGVRILRSAINAGAVAGRPYAMGPRSPGEPAGNYSPGDFFKPLTLGRLPWA